MQKAESINTLNVLIGGGGGSGQLAGRVDVFNHGLIQTTGAGSSGISANSIGGGGGDAGSVSSLVILSAQSDGKTNAFELAIGGAGGSGGKGGAVNVVNAPTGAVDSGTILTTGSTAHGIFAQSLGGGGGNGSSVVSISGSTGGQGQHLDRAQPRRQGRQRQYRRRSDRRQQRHHRTPRATAASASSPSRSAAAAAMVASCCRLTSCGNRATSHR